MVPEVPPLPLVIDLVLEDATIHQRRQIIIKRPVAVIYMIHTAQY